MYIVGICDDGQSTCASLERDILQYAKEEKIKVEVQVWNTGEALCDDLKKGNRLDILYLDIELFEVNGIDVGAFIRNELEDHLMQIIYISGKSSYAQKLFKIQPMDFLVKPITKEQVEDTLALAIKIIGKNEKRFEFQCGKEYYYISFGKILCFICEGRKIRVVTEDGEKEFYGKMKDILKALPSDFWAIHKSYVVNRQRITCYTYEDITLDNGMRLSISPANRKQVREKLLKEL